MPEIAEVTQCRDKLRPLMEDCQFLSVQQPAFKNLLANKTSAEFDQWILRRPQVLEVENHSKYLWFKTDAGVMLSHFKFTGWWQTSWGQTLPRQFIHPTDPKDPSKYARMILTTSLGNLFYTDPRALGKIWLFSDEEFPQHSPHLRLGPTVLSDEFTLEMFTQRCRKPRGRQVIGEVLLEQSTFSGIGNYLRCEILHAAAQSPFQRARDLSDEALFRLFMEIQLTVKKAFEAESYEWWSVFQKAGQKCNRCSSQIERAEKNKRGIYWCPQCQVEN